MCGYCGKDENDPHTPETRAVHNELFVTKGYSLMCASPMQDPNE